MEIQQLIEKFQKWAKDEIVQKRTSNDEQGYEWIYKSLEYTDELELKKYQEFFDRKSKNEEYGRNYTAESIKNKKPYSWLQNEINMIYSFHKCFAMRNKTRLQCYRDDLAQKGARTRSAINIGLGKFLYRKEQTEQNQ